MPYSSNSGKAWIKRIVKRLYPMCRHKTILDVGAGAGAYSGLLRHELALAEFIGLEVWEPYIAQFQLQSKYDRMIQEDVRTYVPSNCSGFTLLGDVLEHMDKEEARRVYGRLLEHSEFIIISIPVVDYPQGEYMGNPYERHVKDDWSHQEVLNTFPHIAAHHVDHEIGVYLGVNPRYHALQDVMEANKPAISVYGLYHNDQARIIRFLDSVKEADEITLCDTGSTDRTNTLVDEYQVQHPDVSLRTYRIGVSPWRLDDARNTALSLVHPDIDLCLALQISERLPEDWKPCLLQHWEYSISRYSHNYKNEGPDGPETVNHQSRIHSRSGYVWKLREQAVLDYAGEESVMHLETFWVHRSH